MGNTCEACNNLIDDTKSEQIKIAIKHDLQSRNFIVPNERRKFLI